MSTSRCKDEYFIGQRALQGLPSSHAIVVSARHHGRPNTQASANAVSEQREVQTESPDTISQSSPYGSGNRDYPIRLRGWFRLVAQRGCIAAFRQVDTRRVI